MTFFIFLISLITSANSIRFFVWIENNKSIVSSSCSLSMATCSTLHPLSAIVLATSASEPGLCMTCTFMSVERLCSMLSSHSTPIQRLVSLMNEDTCLQFLLCTTNPLCLLKWPIMVSPGMGVQHFGNDTETPSVPLMYKYKQYMHCFLNK